MATHPHWIGPVADNDSETVTESLRIAQRLRIEKMELRARTNANRDLLRLLREQGSASQAQSDLIERYYPTKFTQRARDSGKLSRDEIAPAGQEAPAKQEETPVAPPPLADLEPPS